jgi:hypothetical protein
MSDTGVVEPIVCTLDGGGFRDRMVWIADLNARSLRKARWNDLRLELDYAPSAIADVRQMIAQEQACCAFLSFDLVAERRALRLTITAPETARDAAGTVFGLFQEKTAQPAGCGCISGCGA